MAENALENEFEKINLEEGASCKAGKEESKCEVRRMVARQLELASAQGSSMKVKDRRKNLIKPARLKFIGSCWARKFRNSVSESTSDDSQPIPSDDFDTFAAESFLKMRISGREAPPPSPSDDKDEKTSPSSSQPNSCSAQAKLQQQLSSSEFDSTIEEMSEFLAYHLKMYPKDENYLVDSMYT